MGIVEEYLLQLNTKKQRFRRSVAFLTVLSFLVVLTVSWNLRQTGIALANDAYCGMEEHRHTEECIPETGLICGYGIASPSEEPMELPTEASTEIPSEETTEAPVEETTEASVEETTEAPMEETTEAPVEETTEAPVEETTEVLVEETTEAPMEESEAVSVEEATEPPPAEVTVTAADAPPVLSSDKPEEEPSEPVHIHNEECYGIVWLCGYEEHIHDFSCYSDLSADLEDWDIWRASIPELTGRISEDIILVAQSQLGCAESTLNFQVADDGETQNGITRYGQWYGNPYGPWSNMFTSFCLRFAGIESVPINSGAEKMRMAWEEQNLYRHSGGYEPVSGDIVFLDKNQNGTPESTGVVVRYFDFVLTVIEGDVDNAVVQTEYRIDDPVITGYGMTNTANRVMMFAAGTPRAAITIGTKGIYTNASTYVGSGGTFILYATANDEKTYAIDGNGQAVEIQISATTGAITADVDDVKTLYWTITRGGTTNNRNYTIRNVSTQKYINPNNNSVVSATSRNLTFANSTGANNVKIQGAAQLALSGATFTGNSDGSPIYFAKAPAQVTLWLDGTNGNTINCLGSDNTKNTVYSGIPVQLPSTWKSPTKYQYKLAGWVDISTGQYYAPGDMITVTKDTVLYADWVAATYDIGQFNSHVVKTISTSDFITTKLFDYSDLINLNSTRLTSSAVDANSHSEKWTLATSGTAASGQTTYNFIFVEEYYNDEGYNDAGHIGVPAGRGDQGTGPNVWTGGTTVWEDIVDDATDPLVALLFGSGDAIGKHYLGEGDYLFQLDTDPRSPNYGYYYYDSRLNAASYNQSEQRFYVYDYLSVSSDSEGNGEYSDFLPLNSPTVNTTNGAVSPQQWGNDVPAQYRGDTYYEYESKYEANNGMTRVNWFFGMQTDIHFGLPDDVGTGGNKDLYGKEMHFKFTGDDDVWILIDGEVVLDLGGIHTAASGDINFTTGEVSVNGAVTGNISNIKEGEHTLTILYLERGASMGNCAIYFNLAPRFSLDLQKEDVLTQELLTGATFAFYNDPSCAEGTESRLWPSQEAYKTDPDGNATNTFTIGADGTLHVWGLSPSKIYYIKETKPPDNAAGTPEGMQYALTNGIIKLTLDKNGLNSYSATILDDPNANPPVSHGFTVHNFRIDVENQAAYITVTNARNWIKTTTSVYVEKYWNDRVDHTYDAVTVYLQVTDPDGTVRRIRQIDLSKENNWNYTWTNLPMYMLDPETGQEYVPVGDEALDNAMKYQYSIVEAYVPGYQQSISSADNTGGTGGSSGSGGGTSGTVTWHESLEFVSGETYVLKTAKGCLSAVSSNSDNLCFVNEATAKESPLARWTATVSNGLVRLTNQEGQSLNFERNNGWWFRAVRQGSEMNLTPYPQGSGLVLTITTRYTDWTEIIYICDWLNNDYLSANGSPLVFNPLKMVVTDTGGNGSGGESDNTVTESESRYRVTNTPLTKEASVTVKKAWDHPFGADTSAFEKLQVTVKLYYLDGNGKPVDTGRTETLDLRSNWEAVFQGLPYQDANGVPYVYLIQESWNNDDWIPVYGDVITINGANYGKVTRIGNTNNYQTNLTNRYRWTDAYELPSTGGIGDTLLILIGLILISAPFVYGFSLRRKYERRSRE